MDEANGKLARIVAAVDGVYARAKREDLEYDAWVWQDALDAIKALASPEYVEHMSSNYAIPPLTTHTC
jgi:hypothetical protein